MGPRDSALSGALPTWVRSCRRPARGGSPAGLPPRREVFRASRSWRARPLGSCVRRAWAGGAGGARSWASRRVGMCVPSIHRREGCPTTQSLPTPSSRASALSEADTLSLGPRGRSLGFPPEGKARDAWMRPAGALGEGATPAAKITIGKVERRHEFLHPLQRSAPVLQGRRCRRRHRLALAHLSSPLSPEGPRRCRRDPRPGTKGSGAEKAPSRPGQLSVEHQRLSEAPLLRTLSSELKAKSCASEALLLSRSKLVATGQILK